MKTRLQAKGGFFANGGWKGIYRGLGLCVVALAPLALLFFVTYDGLKRTLIQKNHMNPTAGHMLAASFGEIAACFVRVPAEVVKQRTQAGIAGAEGKVSSWANFVYLLRNQSGEGVVRGLYRGWSTTIMREIPFTVIQFPLYEELKRHWALSNGEKPLAPWKGAVCGSLAGGFAAALTTPLDVIKTRIMLSKESISVGQLVARMVKDEGYSVFLHGIGPRTCWISAGGAIFLGCYEMVSSTLNQITPVLE